ncbi:MAG: GTP-binding protein [Deltaproteobacteria bacterium]|nr:GTP-binding protein [Deltaproteobacteria bacterium]MDQ3297644.1 GTP-binding protein [Myxococcota bacterium]
MRVPLLVLTGFLGAGKTTLLNALVARRAARNETGKLGVIVNELGEIGIDGALLGGNTSRQIELPGGCVCCVLGDDLDRTLAELVRANPGLEAIVLETTGVAEPLPIAWALDRQPVADLVRLAAVVTLVDATNFRGSRSVSVAVDAQVAYADVLLITKAELVGPDEVAAVTSEVRTLTAQALVRTGTTDIHVSWLEQVLRDPTLERPGLPASQPGSQTGSQPGGQDDGHVHDASCRHVDNPAARPVHGIDSIWTHVEGEVDLEELEDQLADLPANYVRIKGILRAVDRRRGELVRGWVAVHRVGPRVSSEPIEAQDSEEPRIVALGPAVDAGELAACLARAIAVNNA